MTDQDIPHDGPNDSFEGPDEEVASDQAPPPGAAAAATENAEAGGPVEGQGRDNAADSPHVDDAGAAAENETESPSTQDDHELPLDNPSG